MLTIGYVMRNEKELTRMHAEFKETYKNSDEFANGMANDYVDLYRSTNDCE